MKAYTLYVIFVAVPQILTAQSAMNSFGARAMSIGYTSSCIADEWSALNNVAGLAGVKSTTAAISYELHPTFKAFNRMGVTFALPLQKNIGVTGVAVCRFGDDIYNEHVVTAAFANTFGLASLGAKINYIQYTTEGYKTLYAVTVSFGGIAALTEHFSISAYIVNINQPTLDRQSGEKLPTRLVVGAGIRLAENVFLTSEIEKDLDYKARWKSGLEYTIHKKFIARTGFNLKPSTGSAGFGFRPKRLHIDYGFQYHLNLGAIHQASIAYPLTIKK